MAFSPALLDTRAKSDEGVWFTLEDDAGNEIFEDGEPVQLQLLGRDCAVAKEALKKIAEGGDVVESTAAMIKGWSKNLDAESATELASIPHISEWVLKKVVSRSNFMTKASAA